MQVLIKGFVVASIFAAGFFAHHHSAWIPGAQDDKKQDAKKDAGGMAMPELSPEHKWLAEGAGKFKATGKMFTPAGPVPMTGVQTNTMQQGGFWQIIDYKDDAGQFAGHGVSGYDPVKKKFVSLWVDNWSMSLDPAEGTLSADKKTLTMTVGRTGEDGKPVTMTETLTRKDDKTCVFEMTMPGPDGKPMKVVELTYTKM